MLTRTTVRCCLAAAGSAITLLAATSASGFDATANICESISPAQVARVFSWPAAVREPSSEPDSVTSDHGSGHSDTCGFLVLSNHASRSIRRGVTKIKNDRQLFAYIRAGYVDEVDIQTAAAIPGSREYGRIIEAFTNEIGVTVADTVHGSSTPMSIELGEVLRNENRAQLSEL